MEYMVDIVQLLSPEEIVRLLAHSAAERDKDAKELQAALTAGKLPPGGASRQTHLRKMPPL